MAFPLLFTLIVLLSLRTKLSLADPRATQAALICTNTSAAPSDRQVFVANFLAAIDTLTPQVAARGYGGAVNGSGNTTVYAFGECMKDLSRNDCNQCFAQIKTQILRCLPFQRLIRGGRLFYDGCYIRYDDYMFFNESLSAVNRTVCGSVDFGGNKTLFRGNVVDLVRNLSVEAQNNDGFFVGSVTTGNLSVYGLAQCWEFVNGSGCGDCLANAVSRIGSCLSMEEGRVLNSGCYMRYSTSKFYNNSSTDTPPGKGGGNRLAVILAAASAAVAFLMIAATILFFARKKLVKKRRERKQLGPLLVSVNKSKLNFSYETLEHATNYFDNSNKLGQGGSGSVYKGILPDGQVVAVKRLFFNTRQWVDHFFNEVNLISGIHHKNLVKLLGCSITGPESLLVYEFVANQSVHDHLFGCSPIYDFYFNISIFAWNLYGLGTLCEAVDPSLHGKFEEEEARKLLQIGLLCVQASAELRPSMSMVVKMLKDNHEIPQPTKPPFLTAASAESSQCAQSRTSQSQPESYNTQSSGNNISESFIEPR
ncbi:hypothetical protein RHGRI_033428 [Rhododendron griersonianum]|uniref:Cysteine-rich receptor-like protein kinase 3 n=1 Tax=Rhododendron griersonianum TaxID=479676 RepID=A0AAV6HZU0_9ERIC|nr:hypothetical protein RHGRI_033428 [Rhododendron griersonianum]